MILGARARSRHSPAPKPGAGEAAPLPIPVELPPESPASTLTSLEKEVIDLFVQLCRVLGLPRSLAEIYGLLFISHKALSMDDIIVRLDLSKGSASQGLKFLRNAGAVRTVHTAEDRRIRYEVVAELRKLVTRFLSDQIVPQLQSGQERLERLATMAKKLPPAERSHAAARIGMLQSWRKRGHRFLPIMVKMMGD